MGEESIRNIVHDCGNVDLPPLTEDVQKRCMFRLWGEGRQLQDCPQGPAPPVFKGYSQGVGGL